MGRQPAERGVAYAWSTVISGGEGGQYAIVFPMKSWADMAAPAKPLWEMMEDEVGRMETEAIRASMRECIEKEHSAVARFREDLSYMPAP